MLALRGRRRFHNSPALRGGVRFLKEKAGFGPGEGPSSGKKVALRPSFFSTSNL